MGKHNELLVFVAYALYRGLDKQFFECKIVNVFLLISLNKCFGCSEEPSHRCKTKFLTVYPTIYLPK